MTPFLYRVASLFYRQYGADINRPAFVFPNRRAGLFFQKYLSKMADAPIFSPTILTINDLFVQLSGSRQADKIGMLFLLYKIYVRHSGSTESFDDFLYWGEMLLGDFDDVDKYMVDARMLFTNVTDLREITGDFSFLSEEQVAAIRTFWSSFNPEGSTNQEEFLSVWKTLYALYTDLREALAAEGCGYEGMIFRNVVERMERGEAFDLPYEKIIFVGLNALSVAEERFLRQLRKRGIADFYWDYASPKVRDKGNKASYFVEQNLRNFPSQYPLEQDEESDTQIEVIGIPSGIGQAKQVYALLEELCRENGMSSDEQALRTAVILPDEHLLVPVLSSIPQEIRRINVTMGYPLAGTPVASLMEYVLALQKNLRTVDGEPMFYFRDVLPVLNHQYVSTADPKTVADMVKDIAENNRNYISADELGRSPLLSVIFRPVTDADALSDYLISVLQELNRAIDGGQTEDEDNENVSVKDIEQEFIFHYFTTVNRLKGIMQDAGIEMKIDTYFRLLRRLTDTITIPFRGEPLSGLQIMGVLETRALDFDRLIILSMNEGVFPLRGAANSFIPYNLRKGFGLPTYEHQDSVWAYHFYRLIHRATHVSLLYDTRSEGLQTGEVSRFVHQLRYLYSAQPINKIVVFNVASAKTPALQVEKTDDVMQRLEAFHRGDGGRALSASALNTYLACPLRFYFSTVENVREEETVSETIENNTFGSILHNVMEKLYAPLCGKMVTADLLKAIGKDTSAMTAAIEQAFAKEYFKTDKVRPLMGQNFLHGEMIRRYVEKILECDRGLTPFLYIGSERRVNDLFTLSDGQTSVRIKGFIDRIDEVGGTVRIVDYKSGSAELKFKSVEGLFDRKGKDCNKAVTQVFLYARMLSGKYQGKTLQPVIYHLPSLSKGSFDTAITNAKNEKVTDFAPYALDFEAGLRSLLDEIFTGDTPFVQTTNEKNCGYCPYKSVCGRNAKK